jgi:hypothetical protein
MANPFDAVTNSLNATSTSQQMQSLNAINENLLAESLRAMQSSQSTTGGGSGVGDVLSAVGGALGGGLGLSSLISGVGDLFGGGGSEVPAAPIPYTQPLPIQLDAGFNAAGGGTPFAADSAEGNLPRAMRNTATTGTTSSQGASQVTIQVQALDSQSILDRSQDIALAIRQAMLETTVLNDVIRQV